MKAYESGAPSYFATPPVNLINSYHASLIQLTKESPSLEDRFRLHREASERVKAAATELGLKQIALEPEFAANGMTTVRAMSISLPEGGHSCLSFSSCIARMVSSHQTFCRALRNVVSSSLEDY